MTNVNFRHTSLFLAEAFDAWRVIPRLMLLAYGYLVFNLYIWYKNIPTYVQEKCDSNIVATLIAKGMSYPEVKQFACTVADVVGGPTTAQSTFVTTIIGLSTGIFGLYTTTGRKWDVWEPSYDDRDRGGRGHDDWDGFEHRGRDKRDRSDPPPTVNIFASEAETAVNQPVIAPVVAPVIAPEVSQPPIAPVVAPVVTPEPDFTPEDDTDDTVELDDDEPRA